MPIVDFNHLDQYEAAIEFLAARGLGFHTRPPLRVVVRQVDYHALEEAGIVSASTTKPNGSRPKQAHLAKRRVGR